MTSYLSGASFFVKFAFNLVVRKMDMQPLVKISVYDYLWNNSNSLLTFASKMVPNMIPVDNLGVLHMVS